MNKPNRYNSSINNICPHGKFDLKGLSGRYCKNNCSKYMKDCSKYKK